MSKKLTPRVIYTCRQQNRQKACINAELGARDGVLSAFPLIAKIWQQPARSLHNALCDDAADCLPHFSVYMLRAFFILAGDVHFHVIVQTININVQIFAVRILTAEYKVFCLILSELPCAAKVINCLFQLAFQVGAISFGRPSLI